MQVSRQHNHSFGFDRKRKGERRTWLVLGLTAAMMVVEISAGVAFGSMALLADGLHMGSHVAALGINGFAYMYARRHAFNPDYSFGTGKINALGGFSGAILLAVFAVYMVGESVQRLLQPVSISFNQAIVVAVLGLIVNGASVFLLGEGDRDHAHHDAHHHDHNLRSAYLHVLADALTSLLAIIALLAAKYFGWTWMDPMMGIVGAFLVARWSLGLVRETSRILLDRQADPSVLGSIRRALKGDGLCEVDDLHVWSIGPGILAAAITVVADRDVSPDSLRSRLPMDLGLVHVTIEVHFERCQAQAESPTLAGTN